MYDNAEAGVEAQSKAVTAVLWHELDRPDATALEKEQYHQYCNQWCPFVQWVQKGNPPGSFVREKKKKLQVKGGTEEVDWEAGDDVRIGKKLDADPEDTMTNRAVGPTTPLYLFV